MCVCGRESEKKREGVCDGMTEKVRERKREKEKNWPAADIYFKALYRLQ